MTLTVPAPERPFAEIAQAKRLNGPIRVDLHRQLEAVLGTREWRSLAFLAELWSLRRGPGSLTAHEYFYYRLYDGSLRPAEKARFVGKLAQARMHLACNDPNWLGVVSDKLMFRALMRAIGLPLPSLRAFYHPYRRAVEGERLADGAAVAAFLRDHRSYPIFAKPVDGIYSLGAFSLDGYDAAKDALITAGGGRIGIDAFVQGLLTCGRTYVFQERLSPHREIAGMIGNRLSTVRFLVLMTPHGPELFRAVWKIPAAPNVADNFWRRGNMLGAVDLDSGEIKRVVRGTGHEQDRPTHHPDTGRALIGQALPIWSALKEVCLAGAAALPAVKTQSWDVAIAEDGPALIEVNFGGDLNLPQLAWGQGVLDAQYRAHLAECGYRGKL